jgi:predicted nucleic acid-binding protein
MVLIDSSVWIDYFNGVDTPQTDRLSDLSRGTELLIGDLVMIEVLQGFSSQRDHDWALSEFSLLMHLAIAGGAIARQGAVNYRTLRTKGVTIRKTIDTLIATRCIVDDIPLLFSDRDFEPFVEHLGLIDAMVDAG